MRVTTTDPMTGNDVNNLEDAPFVIEGKGDDALKIYFESLDSRQEYLAMTVSEPDSSILDIYESVKDNEMMGTIN